MGEAVTLIIGLVLVFIIAGAFKVFHVTEEKINKIFRLE
jgi:hypothetical protein